MNYQIHVTDNNNNVCEVRMPSQSIHAMLEGIIFGGMINVTLPLYGPDNSGHTGPIATMVISRDPIMPSELTSEPISEKELAVPLPPEDMIPNGSLPATRRHVDI